MWIGIAAVFLGGIFIAEVGRRSRAGQLSRNHLIGIRTTTTLADDETWERVHSAAGSWLLAAGVVEAMAAVSAAALAITGMGEGVVATLLIGGTVATVVLIVLGAHLSERILEDEVPR